MSEMVHLSHYLGATERKIARARETARRHRLERAAAFGWPEDIQCGDCGDTGIVPERQTTCYCDAGIEQQRRREFEQRWALIVPPRFVAYSLDSSPQPKVAAKVRAWLAGEPWRNGRNLILSGTTGTGKTGLGVGIMRAVLEAGIVPAMANVPHWLDEQRPRDGYVSDAGKRAMADAVRPPLLVLDDLGAERSTEWAQERLYRLINDRYEAQRSTVVTTNAPDLMALGEQVGKRTVSRLAEGATIVMVAGTDLRMAGSRQ